MLNGTIPQELQTALNRLPPFWAYVLRHWPFVNTQMFHIGLTLRPLAGCSLSPAEPRLVDLAGKILADPLTVLDPLCRRPGYSICDRDFNDHWGNCPSLFTKLVVHWTRGEGTSESVACVSSAPALPAMAERAG